MDMLKHIINERLWELNPDNPGDSEIIVQGYGRLTLTQAKKKLADYMTYALKSVEQGKWSEVRGMFTSGVPEAMAKAIEEAENELSRLKH